MKISDLITSSLHYLARNGKNAHAAIFVMLLLLPLIILPPFLFVSNAANASVQIDNSSRESPKLNNLNNTGGGHAKVSSKLPRPSVKIIKNSEATNSTALVLVNCLNLDNGTTRICRYAERDYPYYYYSLDSRKNKAQCQHVHFDQSDALEIRDLYRTCVLNHASITNGTRRESCPVTLLATIQNHYCYWLLRARNHIMFLFETTRDKMGNDFTTNAMLFVRYKCLISELHNISQFIHFLLT